MASNFEHAARRGEGPELTQDQLDFIEYLVDPRPVSEKGSQNKFCEEHGYNTATASIWKRKQKFKEAWEKRLAEMNISPDRTQEIINALHRNAVAGDTKAAQLYMQLVDRISPQTMIIKQTTAADMTDAELAAALRDRMAVVEDDEDVG